MVDSRTVALRRQRGQIAALAVLGALVLLAGAFFRLQILSGDQYALRSAENRIRAEINADGGTLAEVVDLYKWEKKVVGGGES